jgi:hypothetical protein
MITDITIAPKECSEEIRNKADFVCTGDHDELACSTEERMSYYPTYCQQIFDTDLGKMPVCIDPDTKKRVDFNGNEI